MGPYRPPQKAKAQDLFERKATKKRGDSPFFLL